MIFSKACILCYYYIQVILCIKCTCYLRAHLTQRTNFFINNTFGLHCWRRGMFGCWRLSIMCRGKRILIIGHGSPIGVVLGISISVFAGYHDIRARNKRWFWRRRTCYRLFFTFPHVVEIFVSFRVPPQLPSRILLLYHNILIHRSYGNRLFLPTI